MNSSSSDSDSGSDSGSNSGSDSGSDSGSNSDSDSGSDSGSNSGSDSGSDSGSNSGSDSGSDSGSNSGSDSGSDSGSNSGSDSGTSSNSSSTSSNNNSIISDSIVPKAVVPHCITIPKNLVPKAVVQRCTTTPKDLLSQQNMSIKEAERILGESPRHRVTVIDLTTDEVDVVVKDCPKPKRLEPLIVDVMRGERRGQWCKPLVYGERCSCGMIMYDADEKGLSSWDINIAMRQGNIGVAILRSKSGNENRTTEVEQARMGTFGNIVDKEWNIKRPPEVLNMTWTAMRAQLSEPKLDAIPVSPRWDVLDWVNAVDYKAWWAKTVDGPVVDGTWPFENTKSGHKFRLTDTQLTKRIKSKSESKYHGCMDTMNVDLAHALLIGGKGSPPHIDTHVNLASGVWEVSNAVGYVAQGLKYIWCLPPKGQYGRKFVNYLSSNLSPGLTRKQGLYRSALLDNECTPPFANQNSMGWPAMSEWQCMSDTLPMHFHQLQAGDRYYIGEGTFHSVVNHERYTPVSMACDEEWVGSGQSDFQSLKLRI